MKKQKRNLILTTASAALIASSVGLGIGVTQVNKNDFSIKKSAFDTNLINATGTPSSKNAVLQDPNLAATDANIAQTIRNYSSGSYQKSTSFFVDGAATQGSFPNSGGYTSSFVVTQVSADIKRFAFLVSNPDSNPPLSATTTGFQFLVTYDLNTKTNTYLRSSRVELTNTFYSINNNGNQFLNAATGLVSDNAGGYIVYGANGYVRHFTQSGSSYVSSNESSWSNVANFLEGNATAGADVLSRKWITTNVQVSGGFAYLAGEGQYIAKVNIATGAIAWRVNSIFTANDFSNNNIGTGFSVYNSEKYLSQWSATSNLVFKNGNLYAFGGSTGYFAQINISTGSIIGTPVQLLNFSNGLPIRRISDAISIGASSLLGNAGGFAIASKGLSTASDGTSSYVSYVDLNGIIKKSNNVFATATPTVQAQIANPGSIRKLTPNGFGGVNVLTWNIDLSIKEIYNYRIAQAGRPAALPTFAGFGSTLITQPSIYRRFTSQLFNFDAEGNVLSTNTNWTDQDRLKTSGGVTYDKIEYETGQIISKNFFIGSDSYASIRNIFYDGNGGYYAITVNNTIRHLNASGYELTWKSDVPEATEANSNNYIKASATQIKTVLDANSASVSAVNLDLSSIILAKNGSIDVLKVNSSGTTSAVGSTSITGFTAKSIEDLGNSTYLITLIWNANPARAAVMILSLKQNGSTVSANFTSINSGAYNFIGSYVKPVVTQENNGTRFIILPKLGKVNEFKYLKYTASTNTLSVASLPSGASLSLPTGATIANLVINPRNNNLVVTYFQGNQIKFRIYGTLFTRYAKNEIPYSNFPPSNSSSSDVKPYLDFTPPNSSTIFANNSVNNPIISQVSNTFSSTDFISKVYQGNSNLVFAWGKNIYSLDFNPTTSLSAGSSTSQYGLPYIESLSLNTLTDSNSFSSSSTASIAPSNFYINAIESDGLGGYLVAGNSSIIFRLSLVNGKLQLINYENIDSFNGTNVIVNSINNDEQGKFLLSAISDNNFNSVQINKLLTAGTIDISNPYGATIDDPSTSQMQNLWNAYKSTTALSTISNGTSTVNITQQQAYLLNRKQIKIPQNSVDSIRNILRFTGGTPNVDGSTTPAFSINESALFGTLGKSFYPNIDVQYSFEGFSTNGVQNWVTGASNFQSLFQLNSNFNSPTVAGFKLTAQQIANFSPDKLMIRYKVNTESLTSDFSTANIAISTNDLVIQSTKTGTPNAVISQNLINNNIIYLQSNASGAFLSDINSPFNPGVSNFWNSFSTSPKGDDNINSFTLVPANSSSPLSNANFEIQLPRSMENIPAIVEGRIEVKFRDAASPNTWYTLAQIKAGNLTINSSTNLEWSFFTVGNNQEITATNGTSSTVGNGSFGANQTFPQAINNETILPIDIANSSIANWNIALSGDTKNISIVSTNTNAEATNNLDLEYAIGSFSSGTFNPTTFNGRNWFNAADLNKVLSANLINITLGNNYLYARVVLKDPIGGQTTFVDSTNTTRIQTKSNAGIDFIFNTDSSGFPILNGTQIFNGQTFKPSTPNTTGLVKVFYNANSNFAELKSENVSVGGNTNKSVTISLGSNLSIPSLNSSGVNLEYSLNKGNTWNIYSTQGQVIDASASTDGTILLRLNSITNFDISDENKTPVSKNIQAKILITGLNATNLKSSDFVNLSGSTRDLIINVTEKAFEGTNITSNPSIKDIVQVQFGIEGFLSGTFYSKEDFLTQIQSLAPSILNQISPSDLRVKYSLIGQGIVNYVLSDEIQTPQVPNIDNVKRLVDLNPQITAAQNSTTVIISSGSTSNLTLSPTDSFRKPFLNSIGVELEYGFYTLTKNTTTGKIDVGYSWSNEVPLAISSSIPNPSDPNLNFSSEALKTHFPLAFRFKSISSNTQLVNGTSNEINPSEGYEISILNLTKDIILNNNVNSNFFTINDLQKVILSGDTKNINDSNSIQSLINSIPQDDIKNVIDLQFSSDNSNFYDFDTFKENAKNDQETNGNWSLNYSNVLLPDGSTQTIPGFGNVKNIYVKFTIKENVTGYNILLNRSAVANITGNDGTTNVVGKALVSNYDITSWLNLLENNPITVSPGSNSNNLSDLVLPSPITGLSVEDALAQLKERGYLVEYNAPGGPASKTWFPNINDIKAVGNIPIIKIRVVPVGFNEFSSVAGDPATGNISNGYTAITTTYNSYSYSDGISVRVTVPTDINISTSNLNLLNTIKPGGNTKDITLATDDQINTLLEGLKNDSNGSILLDVPGIQEGSVEIQYAVGPGSIPPSSLGTEDPNLIKLTNTRNSHWYNTEDFKKFISEYVSGVNSGAKSAILKNNLKIYARLGLKSSEANEGVTEGIISDAAGNINQFRIQNSGSTLLSSTTLGYINISNIQNAIESPSALFFNDGAQVFSNNIFKIELPISLTQGGNSSVVQFLTDNNLVVEFSSGDNAGLANATWIDLNTFNSSSTSVINLGNPPNLVFRIRNTDAGTPVVFSNPSADQAFSNNISSDLSNINVALNLASSDLQTINFSGQTNAITINNNAASSNFYINQGDVEIQYSLVKQLNGISSQFQIPTENSEWLNEVDFKAALVKWNPKTFNAASGSSPTIDNVFTLNLNYDSTNFQEYTFRIATRYVITTQGSSKRLNFNSGFGSTPSESVLVNLNPENWKNTKTVINYTSLSNFLKDENTIINFGDSLNATQIKEIILPNPLRQGTSGNADSKILVNFLLNNGFEVKYAFGDSANSSLANYTNSWTSDFQNNPISLQRRDGTSALGILFNSSSDSFVPAIPGNNVTTTPIVKTGASVNAPILIDLPNLETNSVTTIKISANGTQPLSSKFFSIDDSELLRLIRNNSLYPNNDKVHLEYSIGTPLIDGDPDIWFTKENFIAKLENFSPNSLIIPSRIFVRYGLINPNSNEFRVPTYTSGLTSNTDSNLIDGVFVSDSQKLKQYVDVSKQITSLIAGTAGGGITFPSGASTANLGNPQLTGSLDFSGLISPLAVLGINLEFSNDNKEWFTYSASSFLPQSLTSENKLYARFNLSSSTANNSYVLSNNDSVSVDISSTIKLALVLDANVLAGIDLSGNDKFIKIDGSDATNPNLPLIESVQNLLDNSKKALELWGIQNIGELGVEFSFRNSTNPNLGPNNWFSKTEFISELAKNTGDITNGGINNVSIGARFYFTNPLNVDLDTANVSIKIGSTTIQNSQLETISQRQIISSSNVKIFVNTNSFNEELKTGTTSFAAGSTSGSIQGVPILPNDFNKTLNSLQATYGIIAQFGTSFSSSEVPTVWSDTIIRSLLTDSNGDPVLWMRFAAVNSKGVIPTIDGTNININNIGELGVPILLKPTIPISVSVSSQNLARVQISGNTKDISIDISNALATVSEDNRNKLTVQFSIGGNSRDTNSIQPVKLIEGSEQVWFNYGTGPNDFQTLLKNYGKNILHGNEIYMRWAFAPGQENNNSILSDTTPVLYAPSALNNNANFNVFADISKYYNELSNIALGGTKNSPFFENVPDLLKTNSEVFANIPNDPPTLLFPGVKLEYSATGIDNWQDSPLASILETNKYFVRLVSNSSLGVNYVFSYSNDSGVVSESNAISLDTTNVKTLINIIPTSELQKQENISFDGLLNNLSINENISALRTLISAQNPINPSLANNVIVQYSYYENPTEDQWFTKDDFIAELSKVNGRASGSEFITLKSQIKVRFATNDPFSILGVNNSQATPSQTEINISTSQQNQFSGIINLDSTPLSLFKNASISGTNKKYSLNFETSSAEEVKQLLDKYVSLQNPAPFSIYLTKTPGTGFPSVSEGVLIYNSQTPLNAIDITSFALDLGNNIPSELPLYIRIVPNSTNASTPNSYRILNDNNVLAANTGASFRVNASVDPENPFRIDLKDVVDSISNNQLSNLSGQVNKNPNESFAIQGNSTISLFNAGTEISTSTFFDDLSATVNNSELLAFEYYVSDTKLTPTEQANLELSSSKLAFSQELPTNLKVGQFVYMRIGINNKNPKASSFVVSNSISLEIPVTNLYIDLAKSPLEFNTVNFQNSIGDVPFSGTTFINNLVLNIDANSNFKGVNINLINNFTYLTKDGKEISFSKTNLPTQEILDSLLKIHGAYVVKTQTGNSSSGDKQLTYIDDTGRDTGIIYWADSTGIPLPPIQREANSDSDLTFTLTRNDSNGAISFSQNRSQANFDLFNVYANSTISYQFTNIDGFAGFINDNSGKITSAFSNVQKFPISLGEVKYQINGISSFSIEKPEIVHSVTGTTPAISGIATFKDLIVTRNGSSLSGSNLVSTLNNNLLSIEIVVTRIVNSEEREIKYTPQNGVLNFPTNLENGDSVSIRLVPLNSSVFGINYIENPNSQISFTVSGLEVDPGVEAFKYLRTGLNINNNTPVNGQGSFEVLTNNPEDPFNNTTNPVNSDSNLEWLYSVYRAVQNEDGTYGPEYKLIISEQVSPPNNLENGDIVQWTLTLKNNQNNGIISTTYNNAIAVPFGSANIEKLKIETEGLFYNKIELNGSVTKIDLNNGFMVSGLKEALTVPSDFDLNLIQISFSGQNGTGSFQVNTNNLTIPENTVLTYFKVGEDGNEIQIFPDSPSSNLKNDERIIVKLELDPKLNNNLALVAPSSAVIEISKTVEGLVEPSNPSSQIAIISAVSVVSILTLGVGLGIFLIIRRRKLKGK